MSSSLETSVERCHAALGVLITGDATPWADCISRSEDVILGNPFGPFVRGFDEVMATASMAAARYLDGELTGFDRIATFESEGLACVVEVERFNARVGGSAETSSISLRVTTVFRSEDDEWKVVHRHADPITTSRPSESVVST